MQHSVRLGVMALVLACAGCAAPAAPKASSAAPKAVGAKSTMSFSGTVRGPVLAGGAANVVANQGARVLQASGKLLGNDAAGIIASDGAGVVASGAGNLIGHDAAGLRSLMADDDLEELPLAGAEVVVRDARSLTLVPGLKPVYTDASGHFSLDGVPSGEAVVVEVLFAGGDGHAMRVAGMAHTDKSLASAELAVGQASTLVVADLADVARQSPAKVSALPQDTLDGLAKALDGGLDRAADSRRDGAERLALPEVKAGATLQVSTSYAPAAFADLASVTHDVVRRDPQVAASFASLVGSLFDGVGGSDVTNLPAGPTPTPTPARSATPTPAPTPTPEPTAEATPTPAPTATPTPPPPGVRTISPNPIPVAGGEVTLAGVSFGQERGTVQYALTTAVGASNTNDAEIVGWSDTLITIRVPPMGAGGGSLVFTVHTAGGTAITTPTVPVAN